MSANGSETNVNEYPTHVPKAPDASVERFRDARLGLFIHYGLYSILGRREWAMHYERIPFTEYRQLANVFARASENAEIRHWVNLARRTGMRYACLTTKHHEGFCLWETDTTDFNSMRWGKRDIVREFVQACRDEGILPALYISVGEWSDSGFLAGPHKDPGGWARWRDVLHAQVKELMTRYGDIFYIFYDAAPPPKLWDAYELQCKIRGWQPDILISDRCRLDADVLSAENRLASGIDKTWECCLTMNSSWGYNTADDMWKSSLQIIHHLAVCVHEGGNMLLNVGPRADGSIQREALERLDHVGAWVRTNREFMATDTPRPLNYVDRRLSASRGNTLYIALHWYHGSETTIGGIGNAVRSVHTLIDGRDVHFEQKNDRLFLRGLPDVPPDPHMTVVKIVLDGPPRSVPHPLDCPDTRYEF